MAPVDNYNSLEEIRRILNGRPTNWALPQELASVAFELTYLPPAQALDKAKAYIDSVREHNELQDMLFMAAAESKDTLKEKPITNAGGRGLFGYIRRQFLSSINGTPFRALRWFELNDSGLHMFQPFDSVSERIVTYDDILEGKIVLSVDPPGYLDWFIGFFKQFWKSVPVLIGEIVAYEPGSGRNVATAVAWRPDKKVDQIMEALEELHRAENRYRGHKRVPRLVDLLSYYNIEIMERD